MAEQNTDRISKYLTPRLQDMVFNELSPDYLARSGAEEMLGGVPVPVGYEGSEAGGAIDIRRIVINMARVIGGDPTFMYSKNYADFISHAAGGDNEGAALMLVSEGAKSADQGDLEDCCMLMRAALRLSPKCRQALYLYGRACKEIYETEPELSDDGMGDEEKIGLFKAESIETFELLTMIHPDFAMGYYFLGYGYLNMGLYLKAQLTWKEFLEHSSGSELDTSEMDDDTLLALREEVSGLVDELTGPVEIEKGCNMVMSGDYQGGKAILSEYREGKYAEWWPLWYYLGVAESVLGNSSEAIEAYKKVLTLSPSNTDAMEELASIYAVTGDEENAAKYREKIHIIKDNVYGDA